MVILEKGQKVNLKKSQGGLGEILINLNWNARPVSTAKKQGFFSRLFGEGEGGGIDLDLGCLWELKDGSKGSVQALGKNFGNLNSAPFVALDGDDRTGENSAGENLRINGNQLSKIKRIPSLKEYLFILLYMRVLLIGSRRMEWLRLNIQRQRISW